MIAKKVQKKSLKAYENISCMTKNWPDPRPTNRDYHSKKDKGLVTYPGYQILIFLPLNIFCFCKSDKIFGIERYFGETVSNRSTSAIVEL